MKWDDHTKTVKFTITDHFNGSKQMVNLSRQVLDNLGEPTEYGVWLDFLKDDGELDHRMNFIFKSLESSNGMWAVLYNSLACNDVQIISNDN